MASSKCFVSVLVLSACLSLGCSQTIYVDLENGLDVEECLDGTLLPCKTLNYAYHGRNVSADDAFYDDLAIPRETASSHVTFLIMPGVYINDPPLVVLNSTNITFAASESGTVTIRCARFPNFGDQGYGPSGNYTFDDVNIQDSSDVSLRGIIFEKCGNFNSAVHVRRVEGLSVKDCIFRDATGTALQVRDCSGVTLEGTTFADNIDQRERHLPRQSNLAIDVLVLLEQVLLGGAFTFFSSGQDNVSLTIRNCTFERNHGESISDVDSPVILRESGHGGGLLVQFLNTTNSQFLIEECMFQNNTADVDGGGVYMSLSDSSRDNTIIIRNTVFRDNSASEASGGAVSFNSYQVSSSNVIEISDSRFEANNASAGGAVSFVLYQSDPELPLDNLVFRNCVFVENTAENDGTAVGLYSLLHVDEFGFPVLFEDCEFVDNLSKDQNIADTSALAAFRFPITLNGTNVFRNNNGGAITLLNTQMDAFGHVIMDGNRAAFGGGLAMDDRCLLNLRPGSRVDFINNHATELGGGLYLRLPVLRFIIQFFNRLCFVQFDATAIPNIEPKFWNTSINFVNNTAGKSGAAVYASDFFGCSWLNSTQSGSFFQPGIAEPTFFYENNSVTSSPFVLRNEELGSAALSLSVSSRRTMIQPGEVVFITISVMDQLNNPREGLVSIGLLPFRLTDISAFAGENDRYIFNAPSLGSNLSLVSEENIMIRLRFSLLRSVGQPTNLNFTLVANCHPGYHRLMDGLCSVDTDIAAITRASGNNRNIYIRDNMYGWVSEEGELVLNNAPPAYMRCSRRTADGCFFTFDRLDRQCQPNRTGILCGHCEGEDMGISLSLSTCTSSCIEGKIFFILTCIFVVVASFLIMFFNVRLPNELKGFLFYAQVVGLVYQQFESSEKGQDMQEIPGSGVVRVFAYVLGISLPIPFCFEASWSTHWVVLLSYVPPILALATVLSYAGFARCLSCLSNRTSLGGIVLIFLLSYKYVADTSFLLVSCIRTGDGFFRFYYDGNQLCSDADYLPFYIISLVLLLGVFIAAVFLAIIPYKFYGKFKQFSDVLTDGLRGKYRWWGGWDLGRRLVFVAVSFTGLVVVPTFTLFLQYMVLIVIFVLHCFLQPYSEASVNVVEAIILFNLLVTMCLFSPSFELFTIPVWFTMIEVLLPFVYFVLFLLWKLGQKIQSKITKKEPTSFGDLVKLLYGLLSGKIKGFCNRLSEMCCRRMKEHSSERAHELDEYMRYADPIVPNDSRKLSDVCSSDSDVIVTDEYRVPVFTDS